MTTLNIKNVEGGETSANFEIPENWLEATKGAQAVKDSVVAFLAGLRSGTHSTKTRGTVNVSGAKPWRQKGTGRARAGNAGSPVWVGGGVAFGPHPRNYEKRVNKKVERLALKRSFTDRVNAGDVIVVEKLQLDSPKTKGMVAFLDKIQAGQNTLVLVDEYDENLDLASRNLPNVLVLKASSVNTYLMLLFKKIVMTDASLRQLGERLA